MPLSAGNEEVKAEGSPILKASHSGVQRTLME